MGGDQDSSEWKFGLSAPLYNLDIKYKYFNHSTASLKSFFWFFSALFCFVIIGFHIAQLKMLSKFTWKPGRDTLEQPWRVLCTGTDCPEMLWSFPHWRYSRTIWMLSCALCSRMTLPAQFRPDEPRWSLPTWPMLWFFEAWGCSIVQRSSGCHWLRLINWATLEYQYVGQTQKSHSESTVPSLKTLPVFLGWAHQLQNQSCGSEWSWCLVFNSWCV